MNQSFRELLKTKRYNPEKCANYRVSCLSKTNGNTECYIAKMNAYLEYAPDA